MKHKVLVLALVVSIAGVLSGCNFFMTLFGSRDADITSFTFDGMIGTASINLDDHTVTATIEPMDISTVQPTVKVSKNALLETQPLKDGEAVPFVVTAENGEQVSWKIKVTVSYGISFTYSYTNKVSFKHGVIDSSSAATTTLYGDDVPLGAYYASAHVSWIAANESTYDYYTETGNPGSAVRMQIPDNTTGTYNVASFWFVDVSEGADMQLGTSPLTATVQQYGSVGEAISGTFSGPVMDLSRGLVQIDSGFFKVKRIPNDTQIGGNPPC
jgi:hypothetical protein